MTLILGSVTLLMLWQVAQRLQGLNGADDAPLWLYLMMLALFGLLTLNFAWLKIRITDEDIVVAYGVVQHRVRWAEVADCRLEDASAMKYGGFGIRMGWHNGRRRLVYNTIGDPRVVLGMVDVSTPEFVFSTSQPDEVVRRVGEHLGTLRR